VPTGAGHERGRPRAAEQLAELVQVDRRAACLGSRALHRLRSFCRSRLSVPLPQVGGTLLGALAGVVVAAAGSGEPSGISRRVAAISAALALLLTVVAFATGNRPLLAALGMAASALLTSLAAAACPRTEQSETGRSAGYSTRFWAAPSLSSPRTCSGRETARRRSQSPRRRSGD
jgi:hypothetical protein